MQTEMITAALGGVARYVRAHYFRAAASCGIRGREFQDWCESVAGEGVTVAINSIDAWDEERGTFLKFAILKTRTVVRRELNTEMKGLKAQHELEQELLVPAAFEGDFKAFLVRDELNGILRHLKSHHKEILALHYLVGFSGNEISEILGLNTTAVHMMLSRAREKARLVSPNINSPPTELTTIPPTPTKSKGKNHE